MYMARRQNQSAAIVHADINFHYIILAGANVATLSIMLQDYHYSQNREISVNRNDITQIG
jgi:hypothetical protein